VRRGSVTDRETVARILREAAAAVAEAGLPAEYEAVGFGKAVELIAGEVAPEPASRGAPPARLASVGTPGSSPDKLASIAAALGVGRELIDETYYLSGDEVGLGITSSQLDEQVGRAAQEVALLVSAARQGAGDDEWTTTAVIRAVADDFSKLNRHFAEQIDGMGDVFSFSGSGRSRRVKLKRTGYERAAALVRRLQGQEA
jgi:hypothetical protein